MTVDLTTDVVSLTRALCDIESVSFNEAEIADQVHEALSAYPHLSVTRHGNTVVARTELGRDERVILAGHLDTVPVNENFPSRVVSTRPSAYSTSGGPSAYSTSGGPSAYSTSGGPAAYSTSGGEGAEGEGAGTELWGLGSVDMKGGDAVILRLAATVTSPVRDVTYILYDAEEVAAVHNGLGKLAASDPELLRADFAILMEPSNASVEAGCQGTMRVEVTTRGVRAHSARAWNGSNAIHTAGQILRKLDDFTPRQPVIDGLTFHEGLNAVFISGGVAGNVIPDECTVTVNYRFAPDRSVEEAEAFLRDFFDGFDMVVTDAAPGALPGLDKMAARAFLAEIGDSQVNPKFGWTDVARFSALGVPAVNFGPGDPSLAHKQDEHLDVAEIEHCHRVLSQWLSPQTDPGEHR